MYLLFCGTWIRQIHTKSRDAWQVQCRRSETLERCLTDTLITSHHGVQVSMERNKSEDIYKPISFHLVTLVVILVSHKYNRSRHLVTWGVSMI